MIIIKTRCRSILKTGIKYTAALRRIPVIIRIFNNTAGNKWQNFARGGIKVNIDKVLNFEIHTVIGKAGRHVYMS